MNSAGRELLEAPWALGKMGEGAWESSDVAAVGALVLAGDVDVLVCVSTPDLAHDIHCGAAMHACATDGVSSYCECTSTTLIKVIYEASEAGATSFELSFGKGPGAGEAGHSTIGAKDAC